MRKRMAGSDFGFMTVLVKEENGVVRHVIAVNVTTYPDSETPLFSKEKKKTVRIRTYRMLCVAWQRIGGQRSGLNIIGNG